MSDHNSTPNGKEDKPPDPIWTSDYEPNHSSQSACDNGTAKQASSSGRQQANVKPPKQWLADWSWVLVLAIILAATLFYLLRGTPLIELPAAPPRSSAQQANPAKQAAPATAPAFILLGEYNGEVYTFNKGTKKVYAYHLADKKERRVCRLVEFDDFHWHGSGRLLVVSSRRNAQGGIYLLDLSQQQLATPRQVWITDREADPYFPRNLIIEDGLPLVWGGKGERFAFVARDIQDNTQSLFIYNLGKQQSTAQATNQPINQQDNKLIYTPARHFERITDLVWINGDDELAFTAINDGQEGRYRVNSFGGNFRTWDAQP